MATKKATTAPKVTTVTTEVVLGKASSSIERSVKALDEGIDILKDWFSKAEQLDLEIATKEAKIEDLDSSYKEQLRQGKVDLEISLRENRQAVIEKMLTEEKKMVITVEEWNKLKEELKTTKDNYAKELNAELGKQAAIAKANAEKEAKLQEANTKAEQATNAASITALKAEVAFLTKSNADLQSQLTKAIEGNVKIAEAQKGVNITTGK